VWNCCYRPYYASAAVWSATGGVVVSNCIFTLNQNSGGAYKASVFNSIFSNGGGAGLCTLNNCLVTNCPGGLGTCTANNCLIVNNFATEGGGAVGCILNNCTLTGNIAYNLGGGAFRSVLNNCISYYNWGLTGTNYDGTCTLSNCCTWPLPQNGAGNFTNAPLFVSQTNGDYHLQSNSPCINAGNNAYVVGSTDLDGKPRISGGTVDVGAYEFQNPASIISYAWLDQYGLPTDGSADFVDTDGDGMNNWQEWRAGTDPTNPLSILKLVSPSMTVSNVTVTWESVPTRNYYLLRSTNLSTPGSFSLLATNIPGASGTTSYNDTNAPSAGEVLYRVGVQ
jgi:hypothetical protein